MRAVPKGKEFIKGGTCRQHRKKWKTRCPHNAIGRNQCIRQSNLIRNSTNPLPLETACILVLSTRFFGRTHRFWQMGILLYVGNGSFLPELSTVPPFINLFPLGTVRNLISTPPLQLILIFEWCQFPWPLHKPSSPGKDWRLHGLKYLFFVTVKYCDQYLYLHRSDCFHLFLFSKHP